MAKASQTIVIKGSTHIKTSKNATKTRVKGGKKGNPNRCPTCGRFM